MYEILTQDDAGAATVAFGALKALAPEARHVVLRLTPEDGGWDWLDRLHHDLEGALRGMRFLAEKAAKSYDGDDARGQRARSSIARHLETLETLKRDFVDKALPPSESLKP